MISQEGPGWRLAWDPTRKSFPVLLGGDDWAFELSDEEWRSFVKLVLDLVQEHDQIKSQLMEQESISLELERDFWSACLAGDKDNWSLQVLLQEQQANKRGVEAFWPASSTKDLLLSMRTIWETSQ